MKAASCQGSLFYLSSYCFYKQKIPIDESSSWPLSHSSMGSQQIQRIWKARWVYLISSVISSVLVLLLRAVSSAPEQQQIHRPWIFLKPNLLFSSQSGSPYLAHPGNHVKKCAKIPCGVSIPAFWGYAFIVFSSQGWNTAENIPSEKLQIIRENIHYFCHHKFGIIP